MRTYLQLKTPPATEPVTLAALKRQLRIPEADTTEDDLLNQINPAARQLCEDICGRAFGEQTWILYADCWPEHYIPLDKRPIKSVTSVKYFTADGTEKTWATTEYIVSLPQARIVPAYGKTWPADTLRPIDGVQVEFVCGDVMQEKDEQAILLAATWLYTHRGDDPHDMDAATMRAIKALIGGGVPFA